MIQQSWQIKIQRAAVAGGRIVQVFLSDRLWLDGDGDGRGVERRMEDEEPPLVVRTKKMTSHWVYVLVGIKHQSQGFVFQEKNGYI